LSLINTYFTTLVTKKDPAEVVPTRMPSQIDLISLLMLLLFLLGQPLFKNLRLCHFKSDRDEMCWHLVSAHEVCA